MRPSAVVASAVSVGGRAVRPCRPSPAAGWPSSARYWRTSCAALPGATNSSRPPWIASSGTGSARGCAFARAAAAICVTSVSGADLEHARAPSAATTPRRRRCPNARTRPRSARAGERPAPTASAPPDDIPATNTRLRSIRYLRRTARICAATIAASPQPCDGRLIEPVPAAPGVRPRILARQQHQAADLVGKLRDARRGGDLLRRLPAAVASARAAARAASASGLCGT